MHAGVERAVRVAGHVGTVTERPAQPVLIFDGSCGFCRRWVARVRKLDRHQRIELLPLQDESAPQVSGRDRSQLERAMHLVRPDGAVFAGAAAARELFRYLPGGFVVGAICAIPGVMPVAEHAYAWVARRWGPVA